MLDNDNYNEFINKIINVYQTIYLIIFYLNIKLISKQELITE